MGKDQVQARGPRGMGDTAQSTMAHVWARDPLLGPWFTEACGVQEPPGRTQGLSCLCISQVEGAQLSSVSPDRPYTSPLMGLRFL